MYLYRSHSSLRSILYLLSLFLYLLLLFFFFNYTATTEIYTLSLHDALPIYGASLLTRPWSIVIVGSWAMSRRSEEHTSELQSRENLVCRLLLANKNNNIAFSVEPSACGLQPSAAVPGSSP